MPQKRQTKAKAKANRNPSPEVEEIDVNVSPSTSDEEAHTAAPTAESPRYVDIHLSHYISANLLYSQSSEFDDSEQPAASGPLSAGSSSSMKEEHLKQYLGAVRDLCAILSCDGFT